ncbi:cysteine proteinase [Hypoxylon sp. FL0543]|nr:cysteine proteinase [Hypoxylon sp. FL0543]
MLRKREPKAKHVDWDTHCTDSSSPGVHSEVTGEARGVRQAVAFLVNRASQGLATGVHIMSTIVNKRGLNNLGTVVPTNRLNGNDQSSSRLARPSAPRPLSSPPPPKRQKLESNEKYTRHTQSHFVVDSDLDGTTHRPNPRKRSFDNQSESQRTLKSQSSNPRGAQPTQTHVPEFRASESYTRIPSKKRARRGTGGEMTGGSTFAGPDLDSDGDVQVVDDPESAAASQGLKQAPKESMSSMMEIGNRFRDVRHRPTSNAGRLGSAAASKLDEIIDKTERKEGKRKSADSSPDELALETQDIRGRWASKRPLLSSPSLSRRGDITRTKFSAPSHTQGAQETTGEWDLDRAMKVIGSTLRIKRAVSGHYKYEAEKASSANECFLKLRDMSFILHPANLNGEILKQYSYCTINLRNVKRISFPLDLNRRIVSIFRSVDASLSSSPKLLIEFLSLEDIEHFKKWAELGLEGAKRYDICTDNPDELEKQINHMMTLATETFATTDDKPKGDDIKLIEFNAAVRGSRQVQSSSRLHGPTTQVKVKDSMRSQVPPSLSNSKAAVVSDNPRPKELQRPMRTTRSTFALKSPNLESKSPEPVGWTTRNKGWDETWRNSLVFPPQGKNRATVDKEDIPRLDEGEFLNDNLLIFYLRYLQHSLEAKRPDLAQRIYFQNTFFYERLRSSRTNQGINYDSVKTWTSKVDLFTKDYIIVPINEFSHWYVAIIYNAPKLLPCSKKMGASGAPSKESTTVEENVDDSGRLPNASPRGRNLSEPRNAESVVSAVQNDVTKRLNPIDLEKQNEDIQSSGHEQDVEVVQDTGDSKAGVEQIQLPNDNLLQKKAKKRQSIGHRKHNPDQPRIITLDSLGISHSPACSCLKQYLIAELKDKKDIEIPNPGALGMTARDLPEQSNHCDCGLYLLGYIQEFLKDPDTFVRKLLQHDKNIAWDFDPSRLRNEIRDLIFQLQKEQQGREDAQREDKRKGGLLKRKKPVAEHQQVELNAPPAKEQMANQGPPKPLEKGASCGGNELVLAPESKSPTPKVPGSRPTSDSERSRDVPGSFPESPGTVSPTTTKPSAVAGSDIARGTESPRFVSQLPSSTCASSPTRPMVIDDSEVSQGQKEDPAHARSSPKRATSPVVIQDSPQSVKNHKTSIVESQTQEETPVTSPYFAGRHPGDNKARATLHQEPVQSQDIVVDISD